MPGTFTDVIELLIPELQRRGIFWNDYAVPGGTYRENLTATKGQREPCKDHPAAAMIWRAPESGDVGAKVNGHESNGLSNGWHDEEVGEGQERLDNISLQLC
jgi:hypothetical protein